MTNAFDKNIFSIVMKALRFNTGFCHNKTRFVGTCLGDIYWLIYISFETGDVAGIKLLIGGIWRWLL